MFECFHQVVLECGHTAVLECSRVVSECSMFSWMCSDPRDIRNNEISWAIEDSVGVFVGMKKLNTL